jgi:hypothetical protein
MDGLTEPEVIPIGVGVGQVRLVLRNFAAEGLFSSSEQEDESYQVPPGPRRIN